MTITQLPPGGGSADTGAAGAFVRALLGMQAELSEVTDMPTFGLSGADLRRLLTQVTGVASSLEELRARLVAEADERGQATDDGCTSTTAWVRATTGASGTAAGRITAQVRELFTERVAPTHAAWAAGTLTGEQALVIAEAINKLSPELDPDRVLAAQQDLIEQAGEHRLEDLRRLANRVIEVIDPDTADEILADQLEREERQALETTRLRFSRRGDGTTRLTGLLPDLAADMFKKALDGLAAPRRRSAQGGGTDLDANLAADASADSSADSSADVAAGEHGPTASSVLNPDGDFSGSEIGLLSYQQRLGRALVELLEHLPVGELPQSGGLNATIMVSIDFEALQSGLGSALLDSGTEISAGEARRWRATPPCCRWCSTGSRRSSISAWGSDCSTDTSGWPWPSAIEAASGEVVTGRPPTASRII